jgi:hypothetical protein
MVKIKTATRYLLSLTQAELNARQRVGFGTVTKWVGGCVLQHAIDSSNNGTKRVMRVLVLQLFPASQTLVS